MKIDVAKAGYFDLTLTRQEVSIILFFLDLLDLDVEVYAIDNATGGPAMVQDVRQRLLEASFTGPEEILILQLGRWSLLGLSYGISTFTVFDFEDFAKWHKRPLPVLPVSEAELTCFVATFSEAIEDAVHRDGAKQAPESKHKNA